MTIQLERKILAVENLLLDPNNPRFFDLADWNIVQDNMFHIESVQNIAFQRLEGSQAGEIEELKESIRSNGYITAETIIVKPYEYDESKYIVIEGNRRLAAIRS